MDRYSITILQIFMWIKFWVVLNDKKILLCCKTCYFKQLTANKSKRDSIHTPKQPTNVIIITVRPAAIHKPTAERLP